MSAFFQNFPTITYNDNKLKNIVLNAKFVNEVFDKFDSFYPYIVEDWERPDTIAHDYYGSSEYYWVVLMSNNIYDPLYEWPLSYDMFKKHLRKKYGKSAEELKSEVLHYIYKGIYGNSESEEQIARKSWTMPVETYDILTANNVPAAADLGVTSTSVIEDETTQIFVGSAWEPVYVYDYELELNEAKRSIKLLDSSYLRQVESELRTIFT